MISNLFQIESIKIHEQRRVEKFTRFQRFVLKIINVSFVEEYDFRFKITLYKQNLLYPINMISLGNEASPLFRVIALDPNCKKSCFIVPDKHLTMTEAKHVLSKTTGFVWGNMCPEESNFVRQKPLTNN